MAGIMNVLNRNSLKLFAVQYVCHLKVEGESQIVNQISTWLISAKNFKEAQKIAKEMVSCFDDAYHNSDGKLVELSGVGVHDIDEVMYEFNDNAIEISSFAFTEKTTVNDLLSTDIRNDLPLMQ